MPLNIKKFIETAIEDIKSSGHTPEEVELTVNLNPDGKIAQFGDYFVAQARFLVPIQKDPLATHDDAPAVGDAGGLFIDSEKLKAAAASLAAAKPGETIGDTVSRIVKEAKDDKKAKKEDKTPTAGSKAQE